MLSTRFRPLLALVAVLSACTIKSLPPGATGDEHMDHMAAADMQIPQATGVGTSAFDESLPPSNTAAAARLASSQLHSEWVKVAWEPGSPDSLMAFIVYPKTSNAKTPVVVVVHEIFGLATWVRGVANQVAQDGFIAIAPDLNSRVRGGPSTTELSGDSARKLISGVTIPERMKGIQAVADYAMSQPSAAPRYAVIGYCWGGTTTWAAAINNGKGFSGGVAFYGSFPYMNAGVPVADSMAKIQKPVMLLSGSKDARIGASMPAIDSMMKSMGKDYYGKNYEGAIHGFLRAQDDPRPVRTTATPPETQADVDAERKANLDATKDGWPRTISFLKKNLGVK
jgi:carboxymethylenebutenolidase